MEPVEYEIPSINDVRSIGKRFIVLDGRKKTFHIHYLMYAASGPSGETGFAICCIEFGLFSWARTEISAREDISLMVTDFLEAHMIDTVGRQFLLKQLEDTSREAFWSLYRQMAFISGEPRPPGLAEALGSVRKLLEAGKTELAASQLIAVLEQLREAEEQMTSHMVDVDALKRWIADASESNLVRN
jgi:hypothetical protein